MQTVEALISLMFLVSMVSALLSGLGGQAIDDSLYRAQLAEDAWRVLYLRGDFVGFGNGSSGMAGGNGGMDSELAARTRADVETLGGMTGLCIFLHGVVSTNCDGVPDTETTVSVTRTAIYGGKPVTLTLSIKK